MIKILTEYLLNENSRYSGFNILESEREQFQLYRSLVNIRSAVLVSQEYLDMENQFLQNCKLTGKMQKSGIGLIWLELTGLS